MAGLSQLQSTEEKDHKLPFDVSMTNQTAAYLGI